RKAGWHITVAAAVSAPDRVWDVMVAGSAPDGLRPGVS
ncbi:MAG: hypothetical protein JWR58_2283, partial [Pseudonocardia sp.]|nr:hypothetical protein [Pseudonocardia sp.]